MSINSDLYDLFIALPDADRQLLSDSFALACWSHQQGKRAAALKLIREILYKVESTLLFERGEFIGQVIEALPGNEESMAKALPIRSEFTALFNSNNTVI